MKLRLEAELESSAQSRRGTAVLIQRYQQRLLTILF